MPLDPGDGSRFLRQSRYGVAGEVVLEAVGVDHEDDPGAPLVDEAGHPLALAVSAGEEVQDIDGHLRAQVLPGVVEAVEEDLGLTLVEARVVADLGRPELATLVALADGEDADDVRVRGRHRLDVRRHLLERVVPGVLGRVVRGSDRDREGDGGDQQGHQDEG